jgi:serine/threonine protein phosphatase PrpC
MTEGWLVSRRTSVACDAAAGEFGSVVTYAAPSPYHPDGESSQDSAAVIVAPGGGLVLAVADGVGGTPGGELAADLAVKTLRKSIAACGEPEEVRAAILDAFERADEAARQTSGVGRTTLLVAEVQGRSVRTYNTGDSEAIVIGRGGRIKLRTVVHSPVGYQVAAGVLDEEEALHHDERHMISNVLGAKAMRIDVGPPHELDPKDTLVLGSDGLFDNVTSEELAEAIRGSDLTEAAEQLAALVAQRMNEPEDGAPSKEDDLTFVLYRPPA